MKSICDRDDTWTFLIKRDFNVDYDIVNPPLSEKGTSLSPRRYYFRLYDAEDTREYINSSYKLYAIYDLEDGVNLYNIIAYHYNDMMKFFAKNFQDSKLPDILDGFILDYIHYFEGYSGYNSKKLEDLRKEKVSREMKVYGFIISKIPYPFDVIIHDMTNGTVQWIEISEKPFIISNSVVKNIK
jgi:hypothetical protein